MLWSLSQIFSIFVVNSIVMPAPTLSFIPSFNLVGSANTFSAIDTTDYTGYVLATLTGCFELTSPSGIVFHNPADFSHGGCDIDLDSSNIEQQIVNLPINPSTGTVENGLYTMKYTVYNSDDDVYYVSTLTFTVNYTSPTVEISQTVDCVTPLFTSTDTTDYVVSGVTPTITRTHVINYPYSSGTTPVAPPVTGGGSILSTGAFYNGTQTSGIVSDLEYNFGGLIISDNVQGEAEIVVNCTSICAIYCCLKAEYLRLKTLMASNYAKYLSERQVFSEAVSLMEMAQFAQTCGKYDDVSGYLAQIQSLLSCTNDCSCTDGEPTQVTGIGVGITTTPQTLSYSYATDSGEGVGYAGVVSSSPHVLAGIIFEGTLYHGVDVSSYDVAYSHQGGTVDFEVYDVTNGVVLASYTLAPAGFAIKRLDINNIASSSRSYIRFQIKNKADGSKFALYAVSIQL